MVLATSSALGTGGQIIATVEKNIEFLCDKREDSALISIGQVNKDLRVFDFQANVRATVRIRDFGPEVFAVNDAVNTPNALPVGDYIANIFTATSANEKMGTVAITSGQKELYDEGDVITVKATPKEGYVFIGWSDGGKTETYNYTFTGGVVDLQARFTEEIPENGNDGGDDETPTYTAVENPSGDPAGQGWYEKNGDVYSLTEDTAVVDGKTYYEKG